MSSIVSLQEEMDSTEKMDLYDPYVVQTISRLRGAKSNYFNRENTMIIAVMGVTGSGKSSFISQLVSQDVDFSHGQESRESNSLNSTERQ